MVVCASFCWWIPSEKKVKSFFLRVLLSTRQANVHMIAVNESLFECLAYNRQTTLYLTICDTNFVYLCIWQELIWDYSHRWSAITHSSLSGVKEIETDGGRKSWLSWHILSHYLCDSSVRLKCDNKYGFFKIELRFTTVLIFGQTTLHILSSVAFCATISILDSREKGNFYDNPSPIIDLYVCH